MQFLWGDYLSMWWIDLSNKDIAEISEGAFANAYDTSTGKIVEYNVHSGPNIWLGIAIAQYTKKFKDEAYLSVAENIGRWLILLQRLMMQDKWTRF